MDAHQYMLKPGEGSTVSHWLRKKQPKFEVFRSPKYRRKGHKKVMVAHQYWLKLGDDMNCPLWLYQQINHCHRASFDMCRPKDPSISVAKNLTKFYHILIQVADHTEQGSCMFRAV